MVTDTYAPYKNFAETENIQIEQILSERHAKGAFNLGSINAAVSYTHLDVYKRQVRRRVSPEINALSTIIFIVVLTVLIIVNVNDARREKQQRRKGAAFDE